MEEETKQIEINQTNAIQAEIVKAEVESKPIDEKEIEYTLQQVEELPFATLTSSGETRRNYHQPGVCELILNDFVQQVNPKSYFVTSGDAILKARKLESDLYREAGKVRKLVNALQKMKEDNVYLETSWNEGRLILKIKNPRKNKAEKLKSLEENFNAKQ